MPELPDLQVFSKNLQKELKGKKLEKVTVRTGANVNVSSAQLKKKVEGESVKTVYREGKELRMAFRNGTVLGLHMMLHGKLVWYDEKPPKYSLVEMEFEKDVQLALTDFQRRARVTVDPEEAAAPDALGDEVNLSFWKKALQTKARIKNLLLDQKVIRGIGNAYADEILWEAKISPFSVSAAKGKGQRANGKRQRAILKCKPNLTYHPTSTSRRIPLCEKYGERPTRSS